MPSGPPSASDKRVPVGILFGDMKGSTEEAEVDETSAVFKLREYEAVINKTARQAGADFYKVKTEGDGFMAIFATAHSMVQCGAAVRREFQRRGWTVRMGGHYGEVFGTEAGDFLGADVNRAARIQSAADASRCEFLVSDTVASIVRHRVREVRFDAHAPITVKGVPGDLQVFRVRGVDEASEADVPPSPPPRGAVAAPVSPRRPGAEISRRGVLASMALVLLAAGGYALWRFRPTVDVGPGSTEAHATEHTITVMKFENQRVDENGWYAGMLQAAFNTELSKIPELSVIAPEIIQADVQRTGVGAVETARRLGVNRFVTGSFAVYRDTIRIDAHIVSTGNGVQEAAEQVEGKLDDFFALQKQLALATVDHFQVKLSRQERQQLDPAQQPAAAKPALDKYRKFLEAEGVTHTDAPAPQGGARQLGPGRSSRLAALLDDAPWAPDTAHAQDPADEAGVHQLLEAYRRAQEQGDINELARLHVSFSDSQRQAIAEYYRGIKDLHIELVDVKIQLRPHDLAVTYIRRDKFVDKESGEPVALEVRVTKFVVLDDGQFKFADVSS